MTNQNMQIANTILAQLGGNKFAAMTGAKNFVAIDSGLVFALPARFAANGINRVRVVLDQVADLYNVQFLKVGRSQVSEVASAEGVYCDQLQSLFTDVTGLDTHL